MKTIALIGAPNSGKTQLAKAFQAHMLATEPLCDACPPGVLINDSYAFDTRDGGEYEIGLNGGYMANIDIACARYRHERICGHMQPKYMITCGTVVETAVYTAMHFERSLALKNNDEEKMQEASRFQACTSMIATLYMDTFKYDQAFYLPTPQQPDDDRWLTFERNLQAAFQAYSSPIAPLMVEDFKDLDDLTSQRLEKVLG